MTHLKTLPPAATSLALPCGLELALDRVTVHTGAPDGQRLAAAEDFVPKQIHSTLESACFLIIAEAKFEVFEAGGVRLV